MFKAIIADDENKARAIMKTIGRWEEFGIEIVAECSDGNETCRKIEEMNPDISIVDMRMPGFCGADLVSRIRSISPECKIVIVSGYDNFEYTKQGIQSRVEDYILKPIDIQEFNFMLENVAKKLRRERSGMEQEIEKEGLAQSLKKYIESNYTEKIMLEDLANEFYHNKEYLSKLFKKEFGMSIFQYMDNLRIEASKPLIIRGNMTFAQISEQLGYCDESHFSKKFKTVVGTTPKKYAEILNL